jgi:glutamine synthetase
MTTPIDRDDIIKIIREKDVRFIRLQFTDMFGIPKNPQFQSFGNPFRLLFVHCRIYSVKDVVGFNTFLNKR